MRIRHLVLIAASLAAGHAAAATHPDKAVSILQQRTNEGAEEAVRLGVAGKGAAIISDHTGIKSAEPDASRSILQGRY